MQVQRLNTDIKFVILVFIKKNLYFLADILLGKN